MDIVSKTIDVAFSMFDASFCGFGVAYIYIYYILGMRWKFPENYDWKAQGKVHFMLAACFGYMILKYWFVRYVDMPLLKSIFYILGAHVL